MTEIVTASELVQTEEVTPQSRVLIQECVEKMWDVLMHEYPKMCGLAANQLGYPYRIIVVPTRNMEQHKGGQAHFAGFKTVLNPVFTPEGRQTTDQLEGCWSVGITQYFRVRRYTFGRLTGMMLTGADYEQTVAGFPATVAQHEIDHLNLVSIVDRNKELVESVGKVYLPIV